MTHTVNASLGWDTSTVFRPGSAEQLDVNVNFDLAVPLRGGFHAAAGAEWRNETFALGAGDPASWAICPYAAQGFSSGSNGFTVGRWSRANAAYADLERRDPLDRWSVAGALRLERFADFGATVNGKAAGRYALPAGLSVRAAASTGFRAPTPGQQHAFNVTTAFIGGRLVNCGVVPPTPPTSAVAVEHGGRQLRPELTPDEVGVLLSEGIVEAGNFPVFRFFVKDTDGNNVAAFLDDDVAGMGRRIAELGKVVSIENPASRPVSLTSMSKPSWMASARVYRSGRLGAFPTLGALRLAVA